MVGIPEPKHHPGYHPGKNLADLVDYGRVGNALEGNPCTKHFAPAFHDLHNGKHHEK